MSGGENRSVSFVRCFYLSFSTPLRAETPES
jgi:hypothetical protein